MRRVRGHEREKQQQHQSGRDSNYKRGEKERSCGELITGQISPRPP